MEIYKDLDGDSGVVAFEIGQDSITVQFSTGMKYLYTTRSAGAASVAEMQRLARLGNGLNSYIKRHANGAYENKWR